MAKPNITNLGAIVVQFSFSSSKVVPNNFGLEPKEKINPFIRNGKVVFSNEEGSCSVKNLPKKLVEYGFELATARYFVVESDKNDRRVFYQVRFVFVPAEKLLPEAHNLGLAASLEDCRSLFEGLCKKSFWEKARCFANPGNKLADKKPFVSFNFAGLQPVDQTKGIKPTSEVKLLKTKFGLKQL